MARFNGGLWCGLQSVVEKHLAWILHQYKEQTENEEIHEYQKTHDEGWLLINTFCTRQGRFWTNGSVQGVLWRVPRGNIAVRRPRKSGKWPYPWQDGEEITQRN